MSDIFFLLTYNRATSTITGLEAIDPDSMMAAFDKRLQEEIAAIARGEEIEAVILEAESEEMLRRSHARYFDDLRGVLSGI